jgi:hypothetical protein
MKKMYLVLIAAVMAVSFSAFTTTSTTALPVTYQDDDELWYNFFGDPCIGTDIPVCFKETDHGVRQLYYNSNLDMPVRKN